MRKILRINLFQIRFFVFFFLIGFIGNIFSQTADFTVQHIQDEVANTGGTNTTFTPVNSLNGVVELANNNRKTHGGSQTHSGNRPGDDMAGARQLTSVNVLTYYRETNSDNRDMRFNTSIWEYIGPSGGGNELIVRGRYAVSLDGSTNNVTQAISGIINANKCIPFVTGIMNNATSQDADSATAMAYLEDTTTLRIQKGSNGNNVTVYITLVEFTGSNWTVLHGDSGNSNADSGTITLTDGSDGTGTTTNVSTWNEAVIFSHFRADTAASGANDALSDLWPVTDPGSNSQSVDWAFHSNNNNTGTKIPGQFIPVNQGFFVSTKLESNPNDNLGTISSVDGGTIIFKNSQRVYAPEDGSASLFLKSSKDKTSSKTANNKTKNSTPTIRLVFDSPLGYHRQLVIGANKKASNGFDLGYDAFMVDVNKEDMYWNFNNNKFVIQGVEGFNESEEFLLGLIVKNTGTVTIKLNGFENMESNLPVFIKDDFTGEIKNINNEPFEINLEPGVYNDRFKLVFNQGEDKGLDVVTTEGESSIFIGYDSKSSKLNFVNTDKLKINGMVLYDALGNQIKILKLNTKSNVSVTVSAITGLYIVKLKTEKGIVAKKIIIN